MSEVISVLNPKNYLEASKGDTILVVPDWWLIVVNYPFKLHRELENYLSSKYLRPSERLYKLEIVKINEERRYKLAKLHWVACKCPLSRYIDEEKPQGIAGKYEIDGVRITQHITLVETYQVEGYTVITQTPDGNITETQDIQQKKLVRRSTKTRSEVEVIGNSELASLFAKWKDVKENKHKYTGYIEFIYVNNDYAVYAEDGSILVEPSKIDEQKLLELSKYYVITVPRLTVNDTTREAKYKDLNPIKRKLYRCDVYYNGKKLEVIIKGFAEIPMPLRLGIRRRRYALSKYARLTLPYGKIFDTELQFDHFNEIVSDLYEKIKDRKIKPKELSKRRQFEEIFFIRTPERKLQGWQEYERLYEKLSKFAEQGVMYLVYHGQDGEYRHFLPNYRAFRIEGSKITIDNAPPVAVSAICLKGGTFEQEYVEAFNIKRLLQFKYSDRQRKIEMLRQDIEAIRQQIGEPEKFDDYTTKIEKLAESEEYPDNLVLVLYRYAEGKTENWTADWKEEVKSARRVLAGLVKSGKHYDFDYEKLEDVMRVLRVASLYTIKQRGYSPRLGVIFSGMPSDIVEGVYKFVRKLDGRLLALATAVETDKIEVKPVEISLERLKVLRDELAEVVN